MAVIEKERFGKVLEFYDFETGLVSDEKSGKDFEFYNPDAQKFLKVGDAVVYVTVTPPSGKKIVKQVIKK
jgi:hypothetical protein